MDTRQLANITLKLLSRLTCVYDPLHSWWRSCHLFEVHNSDLILQPGILESSEEFVSAEAGHTETESGISYCISCENPSWVDIHPMSVVYTCLIPECAVISWHHQLTVIFKQIINDHMRQRKWPRGVLGSAWSRPTWPSLGLSCAFLLLPLQSSNSQTPFRCSSNSRSRRCCSNLLDRFVQDMLHD